MNEKIPFSWHVTIQIWVVFLVGWKFGLCNQKHYPYLSSDTSSVWNFCTRFSDVISRGNHRLHSVSNPAGLTQAHNVSWKKQSTGSRRTNKKKTLSPGVRHITHVWWWRERISRISETLLTILWILSKLLQTSYKHALHRPLCSDLRHLDNENQGNLSCMQVSYRHLPSP